MLIKVQCCLKTDPGYIFETEDIDEFLSGIASLNADGGGDTPEPSVGALIRAIRASEEGSPIYVFTDASAKDAYRIREAQALIAQKLVTITFALVTSSRKRRGNNGIQEDTPEIVKRQLDETYELLATFSGGQVLTLTTTDLSSLGELVSFSANQRRTTIFRERGQSTSYTFYVDSSVEQVIVSVNGEDGVTLISPSGMNKNTTFPPMKHFTLCL